MDTRSPDSSSLPPCAADGSLLHVARDWQDPRDIASALAHAGLSAAAARGAPARRGRGEYCDLVRRLAEFSKHATRGDAHVDTGTN
mgnify:CR=1 FL=1